VSRLGARRLLSLRIALAQRYGRHLPLVIVFSDAPENASGETFPFIDAAFDVNSLPSLEALPDLVRLDPLTQDVLQRGEPEESEFTDEKEIISLWSRSLSMEDILEAGNLPQGTVAARLKESVDSRLERRGWQQDAIPGMVIPPSPAVSAEEARRLRQQRMRVISTMNITLDAMVREAVVTELGGQFVDLHTSVPGIAGSLSVLRGSAWQAPDGRHVLLRMWIASRYASAGAMLPRAEEYVAEAWMLRALSSVHLDELMLLFGAGNVPQVPGAQSASAAQPVDPYLVNVLQEGGWIVFPLDLAEPEPAFMQYLRDWSGYAARQR
jgi:hypothetical protein